MTGSFVLSIDQGTTSTRALLVDVKGRVVASSSAPVQQFYPQDGWVEHDGEDILAGVVKCLNQLLSEFGANEIAGIGIANQRETTLLWDRATGTPVHRAIVWQDRRTAALCERLRADGREGALQEKTGLLADPYFSGTKLAWLLEHVPGVRRRAEAGELAFGTIDSWLIWKLTGGKVHATDATNASRTLFYNIRTGSWDDEILRWLNVPRAVLPDVRDSASSFGVTDPAIAGAALRILGVAGDQQAAAIGQACVKPGLVKATYGTGAFMLMSTGAVIPRSSNRLLGTVGYQLGGKAAYALEGSIFMAGAVIEWLVQTGLAADVEEAGRLAGAANPDSQCILVPAFTGLGAPYWSAEARGALVGMTRDTGKAEIAAAAFDAVCFQTRDLLEAMEADTGTPVSVLRVDGGMAKSNAFLQRLADLTGIEVIRASSTETTALGAAYLAFVQAGLLRRLEDIETLWRADISLKPQMSVAKRDARYTSWRKAVARTL